MFVFKILIVVDMPGPPALPCIALPRLTRPLLYLNWVLAEQPNLSWSFNSTQFYLYSTFTQSKKSSSHFVWVTAEILILEWKQSCSALSRLHAGHIWYVCGGDNVLSHTPVGSSGPECVHRWHHGNSCSDSWGVLMWCPCNRTCVWRAVEDFLNAILRKVTKQCCA